MKLTITKAINRVGLIGVMRKSLLVNATLQECIQIVDNLPWSKEYYLSQAEVINFLEGKAEYTFVREDIYEEDYALNTSNERAAFIEAQVWYDRLPQEDKAKVDLLIAACRPCAS